MDCGDFDGTFGWLRSLAAPKIRGEIDHVHWLPVESSCQRVAAITSSDQVVVMTSRSTGNEWRGCAGAPTGLALSCLLGIRSFLLFFYYFIDYN